MFSERIYELYARWEQANEEGTPFSPDEHATPEEHAELQRLIADLNPPRESSTNDPELPPSTSRYRFVEFIARGGMGEVYRGEDTVLRRTVALKVLRQRLGVSAGKFRSEAQLVARLTHPGIVPVHDFGELSDGRPFFAMKLVEGKTLEEVLGDSNAQSPQLPRWLQYFEQICQAVAYAHSQNPPLLHRDLKPQNVMIGAYGEVLVMDWGIARVVAEASSTNEVAVSSKIETSDSTVDESAAGATPNETATGVAKGTVAYMAPEQARGERDQIGPHSDVFGLGGILCRMLTGKPTFVGDEVWSRAVAGDLSEAFARLDRCGADGELIALATQCLTADAGGRFAEAGAVSAGVRSYLDSVQEKLKLAEVERAKALVKAEGERRRRRIARSFAVSAAIALMAVTGLAIWAFVAERQAVKERNEREQARSDEANERTKAETARDKARQRYILALDAFNDMVFGIQNKLENRPSTLELRKDLLTNARNGLRKLLAEAERQGNPDHTLFASHSRMGDVEKLLGNTEMARKEYQMAYELAQRLSDADPNNAEAQGDLSVGFDRLGDVALQLGNTKDTLVFYRKGLKICQTLAVADPKNAQAQRRLGISFMKLGDVSLQLGNTQVALDYYSKGLVIDERRTKAEPMNTEIQRDLSISFERLGNVALQMGNIKDSLDFYQKGLKVSQMLADADPTNAQAQRDLSVRFGRLGYVTLKLGNTKDALDFYQKSQKILQALAEADTKNSEAQRDLGISFDKLGDVTLKMGNTQDALEFYQKGLKVSQTLADADPNNAQAQRDLSLSFIKLGNATQQLGNSKAAFDFYQKGLKVSQTLADADPNNAQAQRDLSLSFNYLGDVALNMGETKDALDFYQKYQKIAQTLADADPKNAEAQRDLSFCFSKLGDVTLNMGNTQDALDFYQKGLKVSQTLANADPKNAQAQRDLAIFFEMLGKVYQRMLNFPEASESFEKMIELVKKWPNPKALNLNMKYAEDSLSACRIAEKAIADLSFALDQLAPDVPGLLDIRVQVFAKRNDLKHLVTTAAAYATLAEKDDKQVYNAACGWSLASGLAKDDAKLKDEYAGKALALLGKTPTGNGYFVDSPAKLAVHMKQDKDLDPLRDRADFKKLLSDLEKKEPPKKQ